MPLARNVVKDLAVEHGACIRPVQLRRTETDTGYVEQVLIPCGHTLGHGLPAVRRARPDSCGRRNAARAGTSTRSPSSTRTRPLRSSGD